MSDETTQSIMPPGYPEIPVPNIFADGVANVLPLQGQTVRFYLYQFDSDQSGTLPGRQRVIAQIVMPMTGFLQTAVFFERVTKHFISQQVITQEMLDEAKINEGV